ncbi:ATP-binding cassette domain-containing protein [Streptomyces avidinii]|uniref:ATP-binding cassette domain-containing protein n=1 Tax=Streptomyces avidinii TaxID=1895 RepID=UPI00378947AB
MATDVHRAVATAAAVEVTGLTRSFDGRAVIDGLDLTLRAGEFTVLLGRSGCGKSTLLRILAGLDREIEGEVLVPERRAVAFQAPRLMPWKRVWRNVLLGLPGRPDRERAERALAEVGLEHRTDAARHPGRADAVRVPVAGGQILGGVRCRRSTPRGLPLPPDRAVLGQLHILQPGPAEELRHVGGCVRPAKVRVHAERVHSGLPPRPAATRGGSRSPSGPPCIQGAAGPPSLHLGLTPVRHSSGTARARVSRAQHP